MLAQICFVRLRDTESSQSLTAGNYHRYDEVSSVDPCSPESSVVSGFVSLTVSKQYPTSQSVLILFAWRCLTAMLPVLVGINSSQQPFTALYCLPHKL